MVPLEEISKTDGEQVVEKEETTKAGEELVASPTHRLKGKTVASTQDAPSLEAVNQEEHGGDSNIHDVAASHPGVNNAGEPASSVGHASAPPASAHSSQGLVGTALLEKRATRALRTFIAKFGSSKETPPCRSYRNLMCLCEFKSYIAKIADANSEADIRAAKLEMAPFKTALNDLLTMGRQAGEAFKKAIANHKKRTATPLKLKSTKKATGTVAGLAIFDRGFDKGTPLLEKALSELLQVDVVDAPVLITNVVASEELAADSPVRTAIVSTSDKFNKWPLRTEKGRAERPLIGDALAAGMKLFHRVILPDSHLPMAKMGKELQPSSFAILKGFEVVSCERGRVASLRFQTHGSRTVVLTKASDLKSYMHKNGLTTVSPDSMLSFFKAMTKETIDAYVDDGNTLFATTVGPGYGILVPFDWLFAERVASDQDCLGVRFHFWMKGELASMEALSRWFVSCRKDNKWLQEACEALLLDGFPGHALPAS